MLTINLISQELKNKIKLRHIYNLLKRMNYMLGFIVLASAIALIVSKHLIQNTFDKTIHETDLITKNNQGYNSMAKDVNGRLTAVSKIQDDYVPWSQLLEMMSKISPTDISLLSLNINKENKTIRLRGFAKTRESLLMLKDAMEADKIYKNIEFPVKNILEKNNIDFDITAGLDINALISALLYES